MQSADIVHRDLKDTKEHKQNEADCKIPRAVTPQCQLSVTPAGRQLLSLDVPRTVLFGALSLPDKDAESPPAGGVGVAVVPDAGHSMAWENPSGLARAIADACSRAKADRDAPLDPRSGSAGAGPSRIGQNSEKGQRGEQHEWHATIRQLHR